MPTGDEWERPAYEGFAFLREGVVASMTDPSVLLVDENRWVPTHLVSQGLLEAGSTLEMVSSNHYSGFEAEGPNPRFVTLLQAGGATFTRNLTTDAVRPDGVALLRYTLTGKTVERAPDEVVVLGRRQAYAGLYRRPRGYARRRPVAAIARPSLPRRRTARTASLSPASASVDVSGRVAHRSESKASGGLVGSCGDCVIKGSRSARRHPRP
jgi:hypothetical protein